LKYWVEEECKFRPGNVLMAGKKSQEACRKREIAVNIAITECSKAFLHSLLRLVGVLRQCVREKEREREPWVMAHW
jgi:hypothetical protein